MSQYYIWKQLDAVADQLVQAKLVSQNRLDIAKEAQQDKTHLTLCDLLVNAGFLDKVALLNFIGKHLDLSLIHI